MAGTATAVSNRVSRRQAQRWAAEGQGPYPQEPPPQQGYAPEPAQPAPQQGRVEKLKDLAALKEQGVLTDAEFEQEKARILAS